MTAKQLCLLETKIDVSYHQLAVFQAKMVDPYNDWSPQHTDQGFTWRPGSVSFSTYEDGVTNIQVCIAPEMDLLPGTQRAIRVPFTVETNDGLEVGSIAETQLVDIVKGNYVLIFEHGWEKNSWVKLTFISTEEKKDSAEILKKNTQLHPRYPLLMEAQPA